MYSVELRIKVPRQCYFCQKHFVTIKDFAVLEGHLFCPNCGYEIMESNLEVVSETYSPEGNDGIYYRRSRGFTAQQNC